MREETTTIVEYMVENVKKELGNRIAKVEARCKELGD